MIAPPGLVGAALAAWGHFTGQLALGCALGLAYEAARAFRPFAPGPRLREWMIGFSLLAPFVLFIALGAAGRLPGALFDALRWLPLAMFPMALVQALGEPRLVSTAELRKVLRVKSAAEGPPGVDFSHAFAAITLVGAAAGTVTNAWFYPLAAALVVLALIARVPRKARAAGMAALAAALGFAIHTGLTTLQGKLEELSELMPELQGDSSDPFRERTRIGEIGKLKLGDRIVMRVAPEAPRALQVLLREAAFDTYVGGEWRSQRRAFAPVAASDGGWKLADGDATQRLAIRRALSKGEGLLAVPAGTRRVSGLPGASVSAMPSGALRVQGAPSFVALHVAFAPDTDFAAAASPADLDVPQILAPTLDQVLAEQAIPRGSARAAEARIRRFFDERFAYTLALSDGRAARTLRDFLLTDHKGHCEYFATATTLLLRRAGVPARYTVGYAAQEWSPLEGAFVVRKRHAHAWASAWIDGRWVAVDNTPARWAELEEDNARSFLGPLLDIASWALDAFRRRVLEADWDERRIVGLIAALAALAAAAWIFTRVRLKLGARRLRASVHPATAAWNAVEGALAAKGYVRRAGETPRDFAERVERGAGGALRSLARQYYAARFDPQSAPADIERFAAAARAWLARRDAIPAWDDPVSEGRPP